jgi:hypothetical protein
MDLRLATQKAVSFYSLHNVSTLNQFRKLSCGTVVCKNFASYHCYLNYKWDLIRYVKCQTTLKTYACLEKHLNCSKIRKKGDVD